MPARFIERREVRSASELSAIHRAQLRRAGVAYDGEDRSAEERLAVEATDGENGSFLDFCHLWKVVDGDRHLYDAWLFMVDGGCIFHANTTEEVAGIVQFGLECDDQALRAELGAALVAARLLPRGDASYDEFAAALRRQGL
jgi:hypothetical protein